VSLSIRICPGAFISVRMWKHCTFDDEVFGCVNEMSATKKLLLRFARITSWDVAFSPTGTEGRTASIRTPKEEAKQANRKMPVESKAQFVCLVYSATLKTEAVNSSETSVSSYVIKPCQSPGINTYVKGHEFVFAVTVPSCPKSGR
jgi:hypothetical protein